MTPPPPRPPLFPYTTLFRSAVSKTDWPGAPAETGADRSQVWIQTACGKLSVGLADGGWQVQDDSGADRKSTRLNSSHITISYAVFCLKKKKNKIIALT